MTLNLSELTATWQRLHRLAPQAAAPIIDEASYAQALETLDELLRQVGEDENHPLADLVEGLIGRVVAYQNAAGHVPRAAPEMKLRMLMKRHGLTQQALAAATGIPQGLISRLLGGKRRFTADHARALGKHFGVDPGMFL